MAHNTISPKKSYFSETELIPGLPNDIALECLLKVPITSHPNLRLVSHNWNSTLSHPSFSSLRRLAATAEHLLFFIQPVSSPSPTPQQQQHQQHKEVIESDSKDCPLLYGLSMYNSTNREWGNMGNITIPTFAQCVALPKLGMVIVLGGWDPATLEPVPRVLVINLAKGTWKEGAQMPTARSFFAAAAVGPGTVCVAGGHDGRKNALKTAEVYDVEADLWRALPDMAEERDESHGLMLSGHSDGDDSIWVVSGYGTESQGRFRSDAEVYDPETKTWSRVEGVWPYPGLTPKTTAVAGLNQQSRWLNMINGEVKEFNFEEKEWKGMNLGSIPKSVSGSTSITVVDMGDDRIMVTGNGESSEGECKEEGCSGEGGFMVVKTTKEDVKNSEVNWVWQHVHAPTRYLGFPFSASHLYV